MTLELNEVLLRGEDLPLSLLADEGVLTCITSGTAALRTRWLHVLMGFERPADGYVSIDGEPLHDGGSIAHLRRHIAFAPACLDTVGEIVPYEPPTTADVLALRSNRRLSIAEADIIGEEHRTGATGQKARLLAVAVLRQTPVLLVDSPSAASAAYLHDLAAKGRTLIVATDDETIIAQADNVVELPSRSDSVV